MSEGYGRVLKVREDLPVDSEGYAVIPGSVGWLEYHLNEAKRKLGIANDKKVGYFLYDSPSKFTNIMSGVAFPSGTTGAPQDLPGAPQLLVPDTSSDSAILLYAVPNLWDAFGASKKRYTASRIKVTAIPSITNTWISAGGMDSDSGGSTIPEFATNKHMSVGVVGTTQNAGGSNTNFVAVASLGAAAPQILDLGVAIDSNWHDLEAWTDGVDFYGRGDGGAVKKSTGIAKLPNVATHVSVVLHHFGVNAPEMLWSRTLMVWEE